MEHSEFVQMLQKLEGFQDFKKRFAYPTMAKFQYNMMARIDDTAELKMADLKNNPSYPFALQCQLSWSKNVKDERSAPYQILLGSGDPRYCILLALGIYLELWIESGQGLHSEYVFVGPNEMPAQVNGACSSAMRTYVFKAEDFVPADATRPLGTHSLRKLPATFA